MSGNPPNGTARRRAAIAGVLASLGALTLGTFAAADETPPPSQQEALEALETVKRYVETYGPPPSPTPEPEPTGEPTETSTPTETATPTPEPTTPSPTVPPPHRYRSGLLWSDGAFTMHNAANVNTFETSFHGGRTADNVLVFTSRENWGAQTNPWWRQSLPASFRPADDDLIVAVPLWTNDGNMGTEANWHALADQIEASDANAIVRLGWEMNCCFSKPTNAQAWKNQYNRAAAYMAAAAPALEFSFNPNEGAASSGVTIQADAVYPGDEYVDSIALDAYDWWPAYNTDANWAQHRDKTYGWNWWYNFARQHDKPFGLGEFGLYPSSSASGGDNPKYIAYVYAWLRDKAITTPNSIRYVTYFNETAAYYRGSLGQNPNAAEEYRRQIEVSAG